MSRKPFKQFVHLGKRPPKEICYLYHLDPPLEHAAHYLGSRKIDSDRDSQHGTTHGARLLEVQKQRGGSWHLVRTWRGGKKKERQLKTRSGAQYCPECTDHPMPGTAPRRPDAKYLTRKQRAEKRERRLAREQEPEKDPYADMHMREMTYGKVQDMLSGRLLQPDVPEMSDAEQLRHIETLEAQWKRQPQMELEAG